MESIVQDIKECYFCGTMQNLHCHHLYPGKNRQNSEKYGLKIWLCDKHHNMSDFSVHFNLILADLTKKIGQLYFEKCFGEDKDFEKIFRRNYL